jgi:hypothetical protein
MVHDETVLVEISDERLAAVEEAKRTGRPLQSVGAKGNELVARDALQEAVYEVSNEDSSHADESLPDYLLELKDNVDDEHELNLQKAREHAEYSAELARSQQKAEQAAVVKLRDDPEYFARRIAENNVKLAEADSLASAEYVRNTQERDYEFIEEFRKVSLSELASTDPVTALGKKAVTDISEAAAKDALIAKDRVIYGEDSFKRVAKADTPAVKASEGNSGNNQTSQKAKRAASKKNEPQHTEAPQE